MAPAVAQPRNGVSSSSTERFSLDGPSIVLDPRLHAWRKDIADVGLAGRLFAPHYARPLIRDCGLLATPLRAQPDDGGDAVSELLPGEKFAVLDITAGWAWGYSLLDHRVGYVEAIELTDPVATTHVVCEAKVPVFADGSIGAAKLASMPMGARLMGHEEGACLLSEIGCVPMSHVRRHGEYEDDAAKVAMRLIGAKYLPGGRSHCGIDPAGLIQLALAQCGIRAPRDLDMQAAAVGEPIATGAPLRRGDIVIAGDEGGIMIDDLMLLHASRSAGKVTVEPVAVVEGRSSGSIRRRVGI
jgi:hypothetical protein